MKLFTLLLIIGIVLADTCLQTNCKEQLDKCKKDNVCMNYVMQCSTQHMNNLGDPYDKTNKGKGNRASDTYAICLKNAKYAKVSSLGHCKATNCPKNFISFGYSDIDLE